MNESTVNKYQNPIANKYYALTEKINNSEGRWNYLSVDIFVREENDVRRIGNYKRNYSNLYNTFHPFIGVDGKEYALYSKHYTATRVMSLPDCKDICGEEPYSLGFCPTGFYVPFNKEQGINGDFGFMCGCVWGDDSSWKIRYVDLSKLPESNISIDSRFGYIELLGHADSLPNSIDLDCYWCCPDEDPLEHDRDIRISCARTFDINSPVGE